MNKLPSLSHDYPLIISGVKSACKNHSSYQIKPIKAMTLVEESLFCLFKRVAAFLHMIFANFIVQSARTLFLQTSLQT